MGNWLVIISSVVLAALLLAFCEYNDFGPFIPTSSQGVRQR
jgi:hypothetical protein